MRYYIFLITVFVFSIHLQGQNSYLSSKLPPLDAKMGKCYVRCLDLDQSWGWKTVDCSKKKAISPSSKNTLEAMKKRNTLLLAYQQKLINLGYKLKVTGVIDKATYLAHHKYLRKKAKYLRKRKKAAKKLAKKKQQLSK